jgi:membrane protein DedA with SNARE-associated domain
MRAASEAAIGAYGALFVLMALSWAGVPAGGQAALVAAGVLAGRGELDLTVVLVAAGAGSAIGGLGGYWVGRRGGRALWVARGPFQRRRVEELARGERLMRRHGPLAVLVAPSWIPGVFHMRWSSFVFWNAVMAVVWTLITGLGGYWIGPPITRALGVANAAILAAGVVLLALAVAAVIRHRRRR